MKKKKTSMRASGLFAEDPAGFNLKGPQVERALPPCREETLSLQIIFLILICVSGKMDKEKAAF